MIFAEGESLEEDVTEHADVHCMQLFERSLYHASWMSDGFEYFVAKLLMGTPELILSRK